MVNPKGTTKDQGILVPTTTKKACHLLDTRTRGHLPHIRSSPYLDLDIFDPDNVSWEHPLAAQQQQWQAQHHAQPRAPQKLVWDLT